MSNRATSPSDYIIELPQLNPSFGDRKLAWIWAAAVSLVVVGAMLLFPYARGYGVGSDSLWRWLLKLWNVSDEWKHGMFVFPIAAVLLFLKQTELAEVPIKGSNWGLLLIVPSLFLYWVGVAANVQYIGYLAIQLMLGGCLIWLLGVRFFKAVFFIWCFLFLAYPFLFLVDLVAFPLRILMSEVSVRFLTLIGFHSIREGTSIVSAADSITGIVEGQRYNIDVVDTCSGIRSLFALMMISALLGILSFRKCWKVMILFVAAIPFAVFGNFCRILMLTFGTVLFGSDFATGTLENPTWFHLVAGFVVYLAALTGIFVFVWLLKGQLRVKGGQLDYTVTELREIAERSWADFRESQWRCFILALLTGLTLLACLPFHDVDTNTKPGVIMNLPDNVGNYIGFDANITKSDRLILPSDTQIAKKRYCGFVLPEITTEIVLSGAQRESIHPPEVCLVGQGWAIQKEETIPITLENGRVENVRKLTLLKNQDSTPIVGYFVYWFIGKDKTTDNRFERILLTSWDRLVHRINHRWAYAIVNSTLPPSIKATDWEGQKVLSELVAFTAKLIPQIQRPEVNERLFRQTE